ncbi:ubiquitin-conjugating enzyme/RWD-like protein [Aspergillus egyptiacus]|nr:ubiquitin-conjugating enzyme/RWD-like protein [Aspergillus egyptiacus]
MPTSPSLRRLMKEAAELSSSPSPHFHAAPISDSNLYDWHFTLAGPPPPSPYAGGIYHGRIVLPPTYPLRPPSFRFLTPSGRFEVNREICLSISGHHEETWQPAWGIRTALIAIRSFMESDSAGQVGGLEGVGDEVRREWARASRRWCCEVCAETGGGRRRSNEEVLREWRGYCVEMGVDVEQEEEVEGVPEGLRIGVKKETTDGTETGTGTGVGMAPADATSTAIPDSNGDSGNRGDPGAAGEAVVNQAEKTTSAFGGSTPQPPLSIRQRPPPSSTPTASRAVSQIQQPQQRPPGPGAATTRVPAQTASQDSPWLDRAIFGVLVALILMILRRVVNVEE